MSDDRVPPEARPPHEPREARDEPGAAGFETVEGVVHGRNSPPRQRRSARAALLGGVLVLLLLALAGLLSRF